MDRVGVLDRVPKWRVPITGVVAELARHVDVYRYLRTARTSLGKGSMCSATASGDGLTIPALENVIYSYTTQVLTSSLGDVSKVSPFPQFLGGRRTRQGSEVGG